MRVLVCGARNAIALTTATVLARAGHRAVLADSSRWSRAFWSRFCGTRRLLRSPAADPVGFAADLLAAIAEERIDLLVPTDDAALHALLAMVDRIPAGVGTTFPRDPALVRLVMDKANLPAICARAGVGTPRTVPVAADGGPEGYAGLSLPLLVKRRCGVAGEGLTVVERQEELVVTVQRLQRRYPGEGLLVQEYRPGAVFGSGGVCADGALRQYYGYRSLRRYPACGSPTLCLREEPERIRHAMERVLSAVGWQGFCQMDFILDSQSGEPLLTDINPVHWYTIPFSLAAGCNALLALLGPDGRMTEPDHAAPYTTLGLLREVQRLACFGVEGSFAGEYWGHFKTLQRNDFCWDPLPVLLAPLLRVLRRGSPC